MNQIFVGKVLHRCGECGQFRVTEDCLMCDCKFNQFVLCLRVSAHAGGDHWSEASTYARQSMWQNLHYRADKVREYYGLPTNGVPKPDHEF